MALYLRGGTYWYNITIRGKRYQGSTGETTQKEARAFVRNVAGGLKHTSSVTDLADRVRSTLAGGERITLDKSWDVFLSVPVGRRAGAARTQATQNRWLDFLAFLHDKHPGVEKVCDISAQAAMQYITHVREHGRWQETVSYTRRRGRAKGVSTTAKVHWSKLSDVQKNEYLATCRMVIHRLQQLDRAIVENPFARVEPIRNPRKLSRGFFSVEEVVKLHAAALDHPEKAVLLPVIVMGAGLAMRLSDIASLRWEHVGFQDRMLSKHQSKTGEQVRIPLWDPQIQRFLETTKAARPDATPQDYCFPALHSLHERRPDHISAVIKEFLEANGYEDKTTVETKDDKGKLLRSRRRSVYDAHALRHSFAAIAGAAGIPLQTVQAILGHTSERTTQIYYQHTKDEELRTRLAAMPRMFNLPVQATAEDRERESLCRDIFLALPTASLEGLRNSLKALRPADKPQ